MGHFINIYGIYGEEKGGGGWREGKEERGEKKRGEWREHFTIKSLIRFLIRSLGSQKSVD
jgi:hypothetical protein